MNSTLPQHKTRACPQACGHRASCRFAYGVRRPGSWAVVDASSKVDRFGDSGGSQLRDRLHSLCMRTAMRS
eukprot:scaffold28499_cov65-Phaeocystis_antarctica.AAC.1